MLKALESVVLSASETESAVTAHTRRALAREQGAEGRLWPVVIALALSALVGSAIGWFLLMRTSLSDTVLDRAGKQPAINLPLAKLDKRQQLFSRLRALQVNRSWFLQVVDASQLSSESLEDGSLRRVWTELADEWLERIEQLPPEVRPRLGSLSDGDWEQPRNALLQQGFHQNVVEHLVSTGSHALLPMAMQGRKPPEPFRQLWIAAAMQGLDDVEVVQLKECHLERTNTSLRISAGGVRLALVEVPSGDALTLGINGTPLMKMMVFDAN